MQAVDNGHDAQEAGTTKRQKSRHRASVACATCRERRIRCVVPEGDNACTQCRRVGSDCVIKQDDERRRPISRAYMSTLADRVLLLESMLKEKGEALPPVDYPPKTTRGSLHADGDESPERSAAARSQSHLRSSSKSGYSRPGGRSPGEDSVEGSHHGSSSTDGQRDRNEQEGGLGTPLDDKKDGLVNRLLSTRGHLSFDQLSGRLRFYGGTVNCHVYSELEVEGVQPAPIPEQARRAEKCIRSLPLETHDYLMQLFWIHYNGVLHVVHETAFIEDRERGKSQFYSGFLHVCILAMGYRFSDKSRPDMQRIALPERESTLHREAKFMLDLELERPGGLPSIAALLVLGDLEVGVGRDNVGWMYAGMAMRLCYDIGLQLDTRQVGLSEREMDIRRMTLWACVIYDRYWSLFLGRPLTMKSVDLEIYSLADQFERLGTCMPAGPSRSINTRIYEALIDLMEVAGHIVEQAEFRRTNASESAPDQAAYFRMASLDKDLHSWAARLPADLQYTEQNRKNAPFSFYLVHQQFHAALILLHRPFARYDSADDAETQEVGSLDHHFSRASRAICTKSAITIARIFWEHRRKFDGKVIFSIGMQHAGVAAMSLIAALAYMPDAAARNNNMQYLEVLHAALQDMSHSYQPAERMVSVLNAVMTELRGGPISPNHNNAPGRRPSVSLDSERGQSKRRQFNRATEHESMPPPAITSRQERSNTHSIDHSTNHFDHSRNSINHSNASLPQQQITQGQFITANPHTEAPFWPHMYANGHLQQQMSAPASTNMKPPESQLEWSASHMVNQDFSHLQPLPMVSGLPDIEAANMGYMHLPTQEDWNRWQAASYSAPNAMLGSILGSMPPPASTNDASNLEGMPPQGRFTPNTYRSSGMGGDMNG